MEAINTYFQLLDNMTGELDKRFGTIQSDIATAVLATSVDSPTFMDIASLQPLADLASITLDEVELQLEREFFVENKKKYGDAKLMSTSAVIEAMSSINFFLNFYEQSQF